jgi:hypothetical protein
MKYQLDFYIAEDGILHSHRRGNLESYKQRLLFRFGDTTLWECDYMASSSARTGQEAWLSRGNEH